MPSSWALLLVVLRGACALPAPSTLTYTQVLAQAVDSYNQRPEVRNVFRLLSTDPEPTPNIQLSSLQHLNFTITETRCPAHSGAHPDACDFKEGGLVKNCSAPVPQRDGNPLLDVTCVTSAVSPVQIKCFWLLVPVAIKTVATSINHFKPKERK